MTSRLAGLLVLLLGATALSGWVLGVDVLKSVIPGLVTMKANTAICFVAAGVALLLVADPAAPRPRVLAGRGLAIAVGAAGFAVFTQYAFDYSLGIDQLLFTEPPGAALTPHPNRMAANTTVAFMLFAVAVNVLDVRVRGRQLATPVAGLIALLGFVALVGYVSGLTTLYAIGAWSTMSVPAATGFAVLGLGLLLARPERAPMRLFATATSGGAIARRMVPLLTTTPLLLGLLRHQGEDIGLFSERMGTWFFLMAVVGVSVPLVYLFARSLDRAQTAQLEATTALEDSEAQYRAVTESAAHTIMTLDPTGRIVYANPASERMFGWPVEELVGQNFTMLTPEHHAPGHLERLEALAGSVSSELLKHTVELDGLRRDGSEFRLELSISSWSSARGSFFTGIMSDVSEQRLAERMAAARYRTTRALAGSTPVDEALPEMLKEVCEAMRWRLGAVWLENPQKDALRLAASWCDSALMAGRFQEISRNVAFAPGQGIPGAVWKNGSAEWVPDTRSDPRWVRSELPKMELGSAALVPIAVAGHCLGVVELFSPSIEVQSPELMKMLERIATEAGVFVERRRAERELAESRDRLQGILDNTSAVIYVKDVEGRFVLANRAYHRLFGLSQEQVQGKTVFDFFPPDVAASFAAADRQVLASRDSLETEQQVEVGGITETFLSVEFPLLDGEGEAYGVCVISTNISDRKRGEQELGKARDEALAATRMKSQFLANMSHEIRTPLNGLLGMTELLLDTDLDRDQREYTELARRSGETLLSVLNDILDISKIEAGKVTIEADDFRLDESVEEICGLMSPKALDHGLQLSVFVESDVPSAVRGDEVRVRQVITNLVSNAVKFTRDGEVRVHVANRGDDSDGRMLVRFDVTDTGIGIPPDQLDRIFDSFEQADASTTREHGGTGLGLAIARQLTELMGGEISATSRPGAGSSFTITLPFERVAAGDQKLKAFETRTDLHGVRVLIADDSLTNQRILIHHTRRWGMEVAVAADGSEALTMLREAARAGEPYESLISDMNMPGLDGLALAGKIREEPVLRGTHLLMLSSGFDDRADARRAGYDDSLTKPLRRAALYQALVNRGVRSVALVSPGTGHTAAGEHSPLVLVAEDNEVNQLLALRMLERRGYRVELATNGREAVRAVSDRHYDLVLMDCQMPELDGYAAARAIRGSETPDGPHLPIVAMTAHSMQGDRERCLEAGMDDYLSKPLDSDKFDAALARWVPGVQGPDAAAVDPGEEEQDPPRTEGEAPVDLAVLQRLLGELGDETVVASLVEMFATGTPDLLEGMRAAIDSADADEACRAAHTLKGSARTMGARHMAVLSGRLEQLTAKGSFEGASDLAELINESFAEARDALLAEVGQGAER